MTSVDADATRVGPAVLRRGGGGFFVYWSPTPGSVAGAVTPNGAGS